MEVLERKEIPNIRRGPVFSSGAQMVFKPILHLCRQPIKIIAIVTVAASQELMINTPGSDLDPSIFWYYFMRYAFYSVEETNAYTKFAHCK